MTAPQRIQLRRTRGWRKPPDAIVVARPTKWGNPYTMAALQAVYPEAPPAELRRMCRSDFRGLIEGRWTTDNLPNYPTLDEIRDELAGHDLACWCPLDQPCHADILLDIANPAPPAREPTP